MSGIICEGVDWTRPDNPDRRCIPIRIGPPPPDCDPRCNAEQHPTGYVAHSEWAEYMLQTHEQRQCPGCGLWTIWEPKAVATPEETSNLAETLEAAVLMAELNISEPAEEGP